MVREERDLPTKFRFSLLKIGMRLYYRLLGVRYGMGIKEIMGMINLDKFCQDDLEIIKKSKCCLTNKEKKN